MNNCIRRNRGTLKLANLNNEAMQPALKFQNNIISPQLFAEFFVAVSLAW